MEAESLYKILCLDYELLKCLVALFGKRVLEHLYLVELMSSYHSALVRTVAARLASEAGGVAHELLGKISFGEDLVPVKRRESCLCCGKHIAHTVVGGVLYLIYLVGKLGELSRGNAALIFKHVRRKDKLVSVGKMSVDEIVEQSPLETRAHSSVYPEARSRKLGSSVVVYKSESGAEINVVLRLEIKLLGLSEITDRLVVLLASRQKILVGKVGKTEHYRGELCADLLELFIVELCSLGKLLHISKDRSNVLALFLVLRNELVDLVLLCFDRFGLGNKCSSLGIKSKYLLYLCLCILALLCKTGDHFIGVFFNVFDIKHDFLPFLTI